MNLAVKFYRDMPNRPKGMPYDWPAQVREIGDARSYDLEPGPWQIMTLDEYNDYLKDARGYYDEYREKWLNEAGRPHPILSFRGVYLRVQSFIWGDQPRKQPESKE